MLTSLLATSTMRRSQTVSYFCHEHLLISVLSFILKFNLNVEYGVFILVYIVTINLTIFNHIIVLVAPLVLNHQELEARLTQYYVKNRWLQ